MSEKKNPPMPPRSDEEVVFGDELPVLPIRNAVLFPGAAGAAIAAKAGYPSVQVPAGFVSGVRDKETPDYPFGATFTGRAWSEPTLLRLAYAFEQATQARRPPPDLPPLGIGCALLQARGAQLESLSDPEQTLIDVACHALPFLGCQILEMPVGKNLLQNLAPHRRQIDRQAAVRVSDDGRDGRGGWRRAGAARTGRRGSRTGSRA